MEISDKAQDLVHSANSYEIPYRRVQAIEANYRRKLAKGTYDPTKAAKGWLYAVDDAAKVQAEAYGETWHVAYPIAVRREAAEAMAVGFAAEVADETGT